MNCRNADGEKAISVDKFSEYFDDSERARFAAEFNVFSIRDIPERSEKKLHVYNNETFFKNRFSLESVKFNELWSRGNFDSVLFRADLG